MRRSAASPYILVTMTECFFASDLHGREERYSALFEAIYRGRPDAVFLGGDLLPFMDAGAFFDDVFRAGFRTLRTDLYQAYPRVFVILGNDDPRAFEPDLREGEDEGLWEYAHGRRIEFESFAVYGYSFIPPTPFQLKDWERYDVSRYVDPGCVSPEEGRRTVEVAERRTRFATIKLDLDGLAGDDDLGNAIFMAHSPPYRTTLDRAALDGKSVDHVPLDVHVGSVALKRFIEQRQPRITLHGHVHESARITGSWRDRIGRTELFSAAHDGPELALVRFDPARPESAVRDLV